MSPSMLNLMNAMNYILSIYFVTYCTRNTYAHEDAQSEATFHFNEANEKKNTARYIVKYKPGSKVYESRMKTAERNPKMWNEMDPLFTFGSFIPQESAEVVIIPNMDELEKWENNEDVEYVESDRKLYLQSEKIPYGIRKVHALDLPDNNASNRKVCIIDSGYDITHEDLASNPNIVTGHSGGKFSIAWNYDGFGHGTHVAGTISAVGNNGKGVIGVNRNGQLKIHIVRAFKNNGAWIWGSSLVAAVEACVAPGVNSNIINMSLGGVDYSKFEHDVFDRIFNDGTLLIAAAGNAGSTAYFYPASYESVISVAAVDSNKNRASFSQHNDQVNISAPGIAVESTIPGNKYASWSGTSMAAPHVSGVAALLWSQDITKTAKEIRTALYETAEDLGPNGCDDVYGHGFVRADLAADYLYDDFTLIPTSSPGLCVDYPTGWHDSDGPFYDCGWYSIGDNCIRYGGSFGNDGMTANEACCACGGGRIPTPTGFPTHAPSPGPEPEPKPEPEPSPSPCSYGEGSLQVEIRTDNYSDRDNVLRIMKKVHGTKWEREWSVSNLGNNSQYEFNICLRDGQADRYKFIIVDRADDGICCSNGNGGYRVVWNGMRIKDSKFKTGRKQITKFGQAW